jgi:translation initiation factor IF-1
VSAVSEVTATVLEELPSALYRVELENKQQVLAHPVGTVKRNFVRLRPGDRVRVELSPHDFTRGRIVGIGGRDSSRAGL